MTDVPRERVLPRQKPSGNRKKGSGKTVLAVDIVKAIQKQRNLKQGKVAIVTGESLNKKELTNIIQKLRGGAIIIEHAGKLNSRTVKELNYLMEKKTGELLFVLEDQKTSGASDDS